MLTWLTKLNQLTVFISEQCFFCFLHSLFFFFNGEPYGKQIAAKTVKERGQYSGEKSRWMGRDGGVLFELQEE